MLDALDESRVRHWVGGGWGVAVLIGKQTREHRDLDLAVDAADLKVCLQTVSDLGYITETNWLPVRVELAAPGDRWVDVHPVKFDANGLGRQAGADGTHFDYPPNSCTTGTLCGRQTPCLSVQQQRNFRIGYEHQPKDTHDQAQLGSVPQHR